MLDTNIVSLAEARRRHRAMAVADWLERNAQHLYLSAMSLGEIEAGILKLSREKKAARAGELMVFRDRIITDFGERVLPMDTAVALAAARLRESLLPHTIELADLIIAATAHRHGLTILTANAKHFRALPVPSVNPLERLPSDEVD